MKLPARILGGVLLVAITAWGETTPLPAAWPPDCYPKSWTEVTVDWKGSWDETLAVNYDEKVWKKALDQDEDLRNAKDQIARLRHIELLTAMIAHFPQEKEKHVGAYRAIAEDYVNLDDRMRAVQWHKKIIDDFPDRKDLAAAAYADILRFSHPFNSIPEARAWVQYAATGIENLEKAGAIAHDNPAVDLARRHTCMVLTYEGRYPEVRQFLDRFQPKEGQEKWWLTERAALMEKAGHIGQAAELYDKAGNPAQATALRDRVRTATGDDISKRPPADLEMRWNALQQRAGATGAPALPDPTVAHETLKLSADSGAMQIKNASLRTTYWSAVDQLLKGLKPADLKPLRELQEKRVQASIDELRRSGDEDDLIRLFRRHPWAHSIHEVLVEFGETALRSGHRNQALRNFQDVISHADDPVLLAQARIGLWLALAEEPSTKAALDETMAGVSDDLALPWRGGNTTAGEIKKTIRAMVPADVPALPALAGLHRRQIKLPAALVEDSPDTPSASLSPWGLGPWAIRRIEPVNDQLFVMGPRHIAGYDTTQRWVSSEPQPFYPGADDNPSIQRRLRRDNNQPPEERVSRSLTIGTNRSRGAAERRGSHSDGTATLRALYSLVLADDGEQPTYSVAAFDAATGRNFWSTRGRSEWQGLKPMNEPVTAGGKVYVLAIGPDIKRQRPLYLVCLDGEDGAMIWKRQVAALSPAGHSYELATAGSAITIQQGSLYLSSDLGVIARCDLRDGEVEWLYSYPSFTSGEFLNSQLRREGTSPLIAGDKVIVAPRDHSGVMALNRVTGELLWEDYLVPSEQIIGVAGNALVLRGGGQLEALDLGSGKEIWNRTFADNADINAIVSGAHVIVVAAGKLLRIDATNGATVEELDLKKLPGTELVILPDGSLLEIAEQTGAPVVEKEAPVPGPLRLPLVETWKLDVDYPALVLPPAHAPLTNVLCVFSGRTLIGVRTQPRCETVWKRVLKEIPESVGYQGNLVIAADGRELTALDAATGATRWEIRLPFVAQMVGGDDRVIFAGDLSEDSKMAALEPATGRILWQRWFGKEARFSGKRMKWAALQHDPANPALLHLYWDARLATWFGKEGWRPGEAEVDALTGTVKDVRPFLKDEAIWPPFIAFGDDTRTYTRDHPFPPWPRQGPFTWDGIAYVGKQSLAHFIPSVQGKDLAESLQQTMDVKPEEQYWSSVGLHMTSAGSYIRWLGQLMFFDPATANKITYEIPRNNPTRTSYNIIDFREAGTNTLISIAGLPAVPKNPSIGGQYRRDGLQDNTGKGNVSLICFGGQAQLGHVPRGFPEAGSNPTATLLNGTVKEHYHGSTVKMSGISTLGWVKYDVYFYGFNGKVTINGGNEQTSAGFDGANSEHRTKFIRGVNYVKFEGLSGDSFSMDFSESTFCAIQIVNASPSAKRDVPESIGVSWTGGGPGLRPTDVVGAEVAANNWYTINSYGVLAGGSPTVKHGLPGICVDVFDRSSAQVLKTQSLPGTARKASTFGYNSQARVFEDAITTTDAKSVRLFRTGPEGTPP